MKSVILDFSVIVPSALIREKVEGEIDSKIGSREAQTFFIPPLLYYIPLKGGNKKGGR